MRSIAARFGAVLLLLFLPLILAAPAQADAPTVLYRLGPEASFQEGCFGQCMCPVLLAGLRGTFGLTPAAPSGRFAVWTLSDIDWWIPELETPVTGSGTFRRSPGPDAQQQLVLDLSLGGEPVERYDSGVVPATARFPRIDALASLYDLQCYDQVFVVRAAPARPVTFRFRGEVSGVFDGAGHARFYVANRAHHADVGGMRAGSMPLATEIYQEGLRIPPLHLVQRGKVQDDVLRLILANVRTPEERRGDLRAQVSANHVGEVRLHALLEEHGLVAERIARF